MSFDTTALILTWVAITLLGFALAGIVRQVRMLAMALRSPEAAIGPAIGYVAPEIGLNGDSSEPRPRLMLFVDEDCQSCLQLLPEFAEQAGRTEAELIAVFAGTANGLAAGSDVRVLEHQRSTFERYRIPVTPFGVVIDSAGLVGASAPIGSSQDLRDLFDRLRDYEVPHDAR
jgi:hypothetical protein